MNKIVLDTNLIVSALLIKNSISRKAFDLAVNQYSIVSSKECFEELNDVLGRKKFEKYFSLKDKYECLKSDFELVEFFEVGIIVSDCKDPKDNKFLALALESKSKIIVSGDRHLLEMKNYCGIKIISPHDFIQLT